MAGLFERMGLVRTEYEGMPEIPMQPVSEPSSYWLRHSDPYGHCKCTRFNKPL